MKKHTDTQDKKAQALWRQILLWGVFGFGATVLLSVVVAFVLHEKVNNSLVILCGIAIGMFNGMFGQMVTTWPSRMREWAGVLALSVGGSLVLSPLSLAMIPTSISLAIGFMMTVPFALLFIMRKRSRGHETASSSVPE